MKLGDGSVRVRKLVNNLNANYTPNSYTQWSFQYGAKYVFDRIDGTTYDGYTDLLGVEVRRDLGRNWDIGLSGAVLHSWNSKVSRLQRRRIDRLPIDGKHMDRCRLQRTWLQ